MSTSIDNRIVEMRFDNKQFEAGAKETLDTLDKLKKSLDLKGASAGFEELDKAANSVDFSNIEKSVGNLERTFTNFFGITARKLVEDFANFTVGKIEGFVSKVNNSFITGPITSGFSRYEEEATSIATIFNATKDAAKSDEENLEIVMKSMDKLMWYTDETSAKYSDMVNNIGKFTAAGVDLETSVNAMMGISNWAYLSGQNVQAAGRVMYNVSQALGTGAMKLIDWKSIENASMATIEFKRNALDAGVAVGTLYKVGDKYYDSLKKTEVTAEAIGQSLQTGWFNKDVILRVLGTYGEFGDAVKDYIDSHEGIDTAAEAIAAMEKEGLAMDTIGKKAFLASQEAKTFSEAWDSATEAITTGWSKTYRIIFGDYLQAKELWSDLANTLYDIFAEPGNVRNDWLKEVFQVPQAMKKTFDVSDFIKFKSVGSIQSRDSESFSSAFEKLIYNTAKQNNIPIDDLIKTKGSLMHTLSTGWLTGDMFKDAIKSINDLNSGAVTTTNSFEELNKIAKQVELGKFGNGVERIEALTKAGYDYSLVQKIVNHDLAGTKLNMEEFNTAVSTASGYTEEEIAALKKFAETAEDLNTPLGQLMEDLTHESGRDLAIEGIKNSFAFLASVIGVVKDSLFEVIGGLDAFSAWVGLRKFRDFTKSLELTDRTAQKLKNTFTAIFTVLKTVFITAPIRIIKAFSPVLSIFKSIGSIVLSITSAFGAMINKLSEGNAVGSIFERILNFIHKTLTKVANIMEGFAEQIDKAAEGIEKFISAFKGTTGFSRLSGMFGGILKFFTGKNSIRELIGKTTDEVNKFNGAKDFIELPSFDAVLGFFDKLANSIADAGEKAREFFNTFSLSGAFTSIGDKLGGFLQTLTGSATIGNNVRNAFSGIATFISNTLSNIMPNGGFWTNIQNKIEELKNSIKEFGFIATIRKELNKIWESINKGAHRVHEFFTDLKNNSKVLASVKDFLEYIKGQIDSGNITGPVKGFFEWISGLFGKFSGLTTIFDVLLPKIRAFVENTSLRQLLNFFRMGMSLLIARNVSKFFGNLSGITGKGGILGLFKSLIKGSDGLSKMMEKIGDAFSRASRESIADIVLKLSLAITALAGALYLIGQIPDDRLDKAVGIFRQIFIAVLAAWAVMTLVSNLIWKMKSAQKDLGAEQAVSALDKLLGQAKSTLYSLQGFLSSLRISAIAVGIVAILGAVVLLKVLLDRMADWPMDKAIEALPKLVFLMGILTAILFATRAAGAAAGIAGIGLVGMMVAIVMLMKILEYLSNPKITNGTYMRGVSTLSQIVFMMIPLMWALKFISSGRAAIGAGYSMLLIATAIGAIVKSMETIANIDDHGLSKAVGTVTVLMVAIGALLAVLAHSNKVINASGGKMALTGGTILAVGVSLVLIAKAMEKLATIDTGSLLKAGVVVAGVFTGLILMFQALSKLTNSGAGLALGMVTIITVLGGFLWIFDYLSMIDDPKDMAYKALSMAAVMFALGYVMKSMSGLSIGEALTGVGSLVTFIAGLSVVALTIGAIAIALQDAIDAGGAFEAFGEMIGRAIGGFISGIGIGMTNDLATISDNLTKFAEEMKTTIEAFKGLGLDESEGPDLFETVQTIVKIFMELRKFANDQLGLSGVNWATMQSTASNLGGLLLRWTHATEDVDPEKVALTAGAIKDIVDATANIKNGEGLSTLWYGNQDLTKFATNMEELADGLVKFYDKAKDVKPESIDAAAGALERIANITSVVGKNGDNFSLYKAIFGETDLGKFGQQLESLGDGIVSFSQKVSGKDENGKSVLDMTAIENAVKVLEQLAQAAGLFNTENSIVDLVAGSGGKADLSTLSSGLTLFTSAFDYLNKTLAEFDGEAFGLFYTNVVEKLIELDINALANKVVALTDTVITEIEAIPTKFDEVAIAMTTSLNTGFVNGGVTEGSKGESVWVTAANTVVDTIASALRDDPNLEKVESAAEALSNAGSEKMDDLAKPSVNKPWYKSGLNAVLGFVKGIEDNKWRVIVAAQAIANAANESLNLALWEHSPSRLTMQSGKYFTEGFAIGIINSESMVLNSTSALAMSAMESLQTTMASLSDVIFDEVDTNPTITPVLDLSNVQNGSRQIGSILNRNGVSVSSSLANSAATSWNSRNQNADTPTESNGTTYSFVQNNYSPKALSRIDIYRQTRNQFAALKEATSK